MISGGSAENCFTISYEKAWKVQILAEIPRPVLIRSLNSPIAFLV